MTPTIPEALSTIRATGARDDMTLGEIEARFGVSEWEATKRRVIADAIKGERSGLATSMALEGNWAGLCYCSALYDRLVPKPTDAERGEDWTPYKAGDPMPCEGDAEIEANMTGGWIYSGRGYGADWRNVKSWRYARDAQ